MLVKKMLNTVFVTLLFNLCIFVDAAFNCFHTDVLFTLDCKREIEREHGEMAVEAFHRLIVMVVLS